MIAEAQHRKEGIALTLLVDPQPAGFGGVRMEVRRCGRTY
jgi:hypothetical protein